MSENDRANEHQPQWKRANAFTDVTVPISGTANNTYYASGSSPIVIGPILRYGELHEIISTQAFHVVSTTNRTHSASISSSYWPGDVPKFHIPKSGSSEYVSIFAHTSGSTIEAWVSLSENPLTPGK